MRFPAVTFQIGLSDSRFTADLCRRIASERSVKTVVVIIYLERFKLPLQIDPVPVQRVPGEFTLKLRWVADKDPYSGFANGSYPT